MVLVLKMSLYDDKRFILSHIHHSFITCDDTGMCETVMINENCNRYPHETIYHHPFEYDSDLEDNLDNSSLNSFVDFHYTKDDIELLQKTELELQSELVDDDQLSQSLDIMSKSFDMEIRRRSNTAQKLEKLKKEKKNQSKTKVVTWKTATQIVEQTQKGDSIFIKRAILDVENLSPEERELLEYDPKTNTYYETEAYRKFLFPKKELDRPKHVRIVENNKDDKDDNENEEKQSDKIVKNRRKSLLTMQIERSPIAPINPFNDYTRFDGRVSDSNAHTKRVRIFFNIHQNDSDFEPYDFTTRFPSSMSDINYGPNWIEVIVLANARVCDLIGLICWHYTHLQIGPPLNPDLSCYALKIAEENGDVDNDLPSLTFTDEIKRYGFPCLALVSVETQIVVTVYIDSEFSQIIVNSPTTTLLEIVNQIKKKRSHLFRNNNKSSNQDSEQNFILEQRSLPGKSLDLNTPISKYIEKNHSNTNLTAKFSLIFTNKKDNYSIPKLVIEHSARSVDKNLTLPKGIPGMRLNKSSSALYNLDNHNHNASSIMKKKNRDPNDLSSNMFDIMKAPLYQCFEVHAVTKLYNCPVEMGISETKLEITPKPSAKSPSTFFTEKLLSRFQVIKPMNINLEDVVECHLVPVGKHVQGKQVFKIVYWNGTDFKSIKFESDYSTVDDIVFKLQHVMKMRTSLRRKEYHSLQNLKKNVSSKIYSKPKISSGSSESGNDDILEDSITDDEFKSHPDLFRKRESKFRKFL